MSFNLSKRTVIRITSGKKKSAFQSTYTVKPALSGHSKRRPKIVFQDQLSLNAGQKYCRMLQEHSAILSTFIKLPFVFKIFVLSIFEWPLKTGFTVHSIARTLRLLMPVNTRESRCLMIMTYFRGSRESKPYSWIPAAKLQTMHERGQRCNIHHNGQTGIQINKNLRNQDPRASTSRQICVQ